MKEETDAISGNERNNNPICGAKKTNSARRPVFSELAVMTMPQALHAYTHTHIYLLRFEQNYFN